MAYQSIRVQASDSHQQNFHEAGITKWRLLRGAKIGSISHGETLSGLWIDAGFSHFCFVSQLFIQIQQSVNLGHTMGMLCATCESVSEIVAMLKRDLLPTLLGGAMFWPVCDFVTFKFIHVQLQPLMNSSCAYVWTIYLTYMANR
ncbi:hypothetical protein K1719_016300 [Acacia pycnantha]|nr:hypothetical protein K1719_016300 [Acacia pycnantha]